MQLSFRKVVLMKFDRQVKGGKVKFSRMAVERPSWSGTC